MDPVKSPVQMGMSEEAAKKSLGEFINWGHINFESANGLIHSNCRAVEFKTAEEMNKYFEDNIGTFATQIFAVGDRCIAIVNRRLDEEGQAIMQDHGDAIRKYVEEAGKKRAEAKEKEEAELKERVANLERLQELGKKCEHNHGAVIEENQKLKKEVKQLRKELGK